MKLFHTRSATVLNECFLFIFCQLPIILTSVLQKFIRKFMANENSICQIFVENCELENLVTLYFSSGIENCA